MAIADTAQLIVDLRLNDQLSAPITAASAKVSALAGASGLGGLAGVASKVESAMGKVGNALSHAGSQISGLIKNIGLFGGAIALFSAGGALKSAIDTANQMASAIETLGPLTGDTAEQVSALLAVFQRYGIDSDAATSHIQFMEKAVGLLSVTAGGAAKFQKEFGFSIEDAAGNVKDANTLLGEAADYWNSDASAAEKAALESKLFGRNFSDMIPILNLGSQGILDAEAAAQSLGLTLTAQNVGQLQQYQEGMRKLGEAFGGLELQISLALVPALTDLASNLTSFIGTNKDQIIGFFRDAAKWAGELAGVVTKDVVPVLQAVVGWWNSLPSALKDILIAGFVTGKVTKWLFGFSEGDLLKAGASLAGSFIAKIVGSTVGSSVASGLTGGLLGAVKPVPVFVTNPGFGGVTGTAAGAAEGATGAAEGGGIVELLTGGASALVAPVAAFAGVVVASLIATGIIAQYLPKQAQGTTPNPTKYGIPTTGGGGQSTSNAGNVAGGTGGNVGQDQYGIAPTSSGGTGGNVGQDQYSAAAIAAQKLAIAAQAAAAVIHDWGAELKAADAALRTIANPKAGGAAVTSAADALTKYYQDRSLTALGGIGNASDKIHGAIQTLTADEKAAAARGDTATANKLKADIAALQTKLATLQGTANSTLAKINAKTPVKIDVNLDSRSYITVRGVETGMKQITQYGVVTKF